MKLEAGESPAASFCETMKTRRNLIHASIRMVGTPRCGVRTAQRAVPTFQWRNLIQIWLLCVLMLQALTSGAQPVTKIAAGYHDSLFLKGDGSLWGMGLSLQGELGVNSGATLVLYPEQIVSSNVMAIAAGAEHSLFLKSDGSLWAMGGNPAGQLGDGTLNNTNQPEMILASNVTAIAAGEYFSLFLKNDGSLWAMGSDLDGQLGDGNSFLFATNRPEQIVASNVTAIAAGGGHSIFLKSEGSLWAMGYNRLGELGDGTYNDIYPYFGTNSPEQIVASNVVAIAAGQAHSMFLESDGSLWEMGYNTYGQLGDGTTIGTNRPEQIVTSGVTTISAGEFYSLFRKSDGSLWGMGNNGNGELGDGTLNNTNNRPEQILGPYNQIQTTGQPLGGTNIQLSFVGVANANYALDRATSLSPPNWIPQATNPAGSFGALVFTNPPDVTTNNFWRIRSVP